MIQFLHLTHKFNFTGLLAVTNCLDSGDKDLLIVCCGVLVNMTSDDDSREAFKNYNGVSKLVNILRLTGERDWTLSALVCQTLWNVCSASNIFPGDPMIVLDTLVKLTGKYFYKNNEYNMRTYTHLTHMRHS